MPRKHPWIEGVLEAQKELSKERTLEYLRKSAARKIEPTNTQTSADRNHVSDKLAKMNQAAHIFWAHAKRDDRGTQPKNAKVAAWLKKNAGFSETLADKAATVIRPEWAFTGRKPED